MLQLLNIEGGYYQGNNVLKDISFEIPFGKTLAIIGQNGSGKSSLAKAIINALPYRNGEVWFEGENITTYPVQKIINKGISVFLQGGKVFPHLTVRENILFSGRNLPNKKLILRTIELQECFPIFKENSIWNLQSSFLSSGQRIQLALCMVLLTKPKLLILDEPSASLSVSNVKDMYNTLSSIKEQHKITILLIEQLVGEAIKNSDTIFLLEKGKLINRPQMIAPNILKHD